MIECKNCHHQFKGNFCYNCGQPASTHPINFHYLSHDVQHGLVHVDKGMAFTVKELFTRPGYSIREFIEGHRVKHFKPISLVLVLAGMFGLLFHFFHIDVLGDSIVVNGTDAAANHLKLLLNEINEWMAGHYALVSLIMLPFYALGTFIAFRKAGYNFIEHVVINAFLTGQRLVLRIALFPLYYLFSGTKTLVSLSGIVNTIVFILTVWTFFQFFNAMSKWSVFFRTILAFIIFTLLFVGAVLVGFYFFGPKLGT